MVDEMETILELGVDHVWMCDSTLTANRKLLIGFSEEMIRREVKMTGDGFLASFDGPARGIRCALAVLDALERRAVGARRGDVLDMAPCVARFGLKWNQLGVKNPP